MKDKIVWFDGRNIKNEEVIFPLIYNLQFNYLLINSDMVDKVKTPRKINLIVDIDNGSEIEVNKDVIVMSKDSNKLMQFKKKGNKTAFFQEIKSGEDMDNGWKVGGNFDFLVVNLIHETNIPLELLIAKMQNRSTQIVKIVKSAEQAEIAFGVMEAGSDGVLFCNENIEAIMEVNKFMTESKKGKIELVKGKVIDVAHIGMGYRACIDTTTLMKKNEGMLIGSTSSGGILVSSETHFLPYMELRPFRVNAGAVHSYVWAPNNNTAYITELKAGSKVLCVDTEGNTREVSVGRVKTESRPLLKIEVEVGDVRINTIVQDDWHIRILGGDGQPLNASCIKKGDEILTYVCQSGRHVGVKIDEDLIEN